MGPPGANMMSHNQIRNLDVASWSPLNSLGNLTMQTALPNNNTLQTILMQNIGVNPASGQVN